MARTPWNPAAFGLPTTATEAMDRRTRHSAHFLVGTDAKGNSQYSAQFVNNLHYQSSDGWDQGDLSWVQTAPGAWGITKHDLHYTLDATGLSITEAVSGKGVRWLLPGAGAVSQYGFNWTHAATGLNWSYVNQVTGVKATATVSKPLGKKTIALPYSLLGGAAPLTVDAGGHLVSDVFAVPRAVLYGADGKAYPMTPWSLTTLTGNLAVQFTYDDTAIPPAAFPGQLDPSTTFTVAASGDDGYVQRWNADTIPWPPTAAAISNFSDTSVSPVRQRANGNYNSIVGLIRWDTSILGSGANISAATFNAYITNAVNGTDNFNACGDWYTGAFDVSAWTVGSGTTAISAVPIASLTLNAFKAFTLNAPNTNINKVGFTALRLYVDGGTPVGNNYWGFASYDNATPANRPQLQVTYTTGGTAIALTATKAGAGSGTAAAAIQRALTAIKSAVGSGTAVTSIARSFAATRVGQGLGSAVAYVKLLFTANKTATGTGTASTSVQRALTASKAATGTGTATPTVQGTVSLTAAKTAVGGGTATASIARAYTATRTAVGGGVATLSTLFSLTASKVGRGLGAATTSIQRLFTGNKTASGTGTAVMSDSRALTATRVGKGMGVAAISGATPAPVTNVRMVGDSLGTSHGSANTGFGVFGPL